MNKKADAPAKPDIWLQEHEDSGHFDNCACRLEAEYAEPGDNGSPAFFMCPMHAAAPDLLKACKAARRHLTRLYDITEELMDSGKITVEDYDTLTKANDATDRLEKAIAKAVPPKPGEPGWFA